MPTLGEAFRAAREARHLSLSDVSEQIHIRSVYLQSIEDEDWPSIAAPVYVRGFIRTYARYLGLDAEGAVEHYNEAIGEEPGVFSRTLGGPPRSAGPSLWVWLAGAAALVLVAFVAYNYIQFQQSGGTATHRAAATASPATAAPVSQATLAPIVPTPAPIPSSAAGGGTLVVRARQDSWLQVTVDGVKKISAILPAGSEKVYRGKVAVVRAGNAGGVDLLINGKDVGSLGAPGDVVERSFTLAAK